MKSVSDKTLRQKAMKELKELLFRDFPDDVEKVILFGSRAKGNAKEGADFDILVILKKMYDWKFKDRIYDKTWEIDYKYDILTDIRLIAKNELETCKGRQPFVMDAIENGIIL